MKFKVTTEYEIVANNMDEASGFAIDMQDAFNGSLPDGATLKIISVNPVPTDLKIVQEEGGETDESA